MMKRFNSENIMNQLKRVASRFPLSMIFICLLTLWQLYNVEFEVQAGATSTVLITGIVLSTVTQLLYERFFRAEKSQKWRWYLYGGTVFLIILYNIYFSFSYAVVDGDWSHYSIPGIRGMIIYFILTILLIWIPSIKSRIKFSDSFLAIFKGGFTSLFFAIVLFIGVLLTLILFQTLFFELDSNWFAYISILIFSLFMPTFLLTFILDYQMNKQKAAFKMPKFLHHLITYILIPIMAVYTILLVLYILTNFPHVFIMENLLEPLLLTYAINGWIMLILADSIDNKLANSFKKIFPFLLIFVIAFQMIATYFEIEDVGITHGRYFILLFGVGSIISAIWYLIKTNRLALMPLVAVIAGVIALIPPIDAMSVSVRSQVNRVESLLEENNILTQDNEINPNPNTSKMNQEKINDSIRYLRGINALNQLEWLPDDTYYEVDEFFGFRDSSSYSENPEDITSYEINLSNQDRLTIPISNYNVMMDLDLDSLMGTQQESITVNDQQHEIDFNLEDGLIVTVTNDETGETGEFDFSYILDEFEETTYLSVDDLTYTEESNGYSATLVIRRLQVEEDYYNIEFLWFL